MGLVGDDLEHVVVGARHHRRSCSRAQLGFRVPSMQGQTERYQHSSIETLAQPHHTEPMSYASILSPAELPRTSGPQ